MKNLIMDCDTGQDDAIAIILAVASKKFNIKGITTVGGNANVENCTINTLKILELLGINNIPVFKGEQKPLYKELKTLECVFGESGMAGGNDLKVLQLKPEKISAFEFIKKMLEEKDNITDLQVCATAPLTNFGKLFLENNNLSSKIDEITIMGGCPFPEPIRNEMGNILIGDGLEKAEYNCWNDPEAFDIVLSSNIKNINIVGLNITRAVLYNYKYDKKLREIDTILSKRVADILSTIGDEDREDYKSVKKFKDDPVRAIHDVVAVAYMIDNSIFTTELLPIRVELSNRNKKGQTLIDNKNGKLANVVTSIDKDKFFELFIETIKSY